MFRKAFAFLLVGLLAALVLALPMLYTRAQEDTSTIDPLRVELIGTVDGFDGTTLAIGGFSFDVTGVEIDSALTAGSHVELTITLSDTGEWVVTEVQVDDGNVDDNIDAGNDDDQGDDNGDVGNDDDQGDDNSDANDDDSDVGNEDNEDADNDNDADDNGSDDDEDTRIIGTVEALGNGFIIIGGQTIDTTDAEIEDPLVVGSLVEVEVLFSNGQWVASEVKFTETDGSSSGSGNVDLPGDCTVPAGWTTYVIQSGDSLSTIAARSDSNVPDLTEVNCITISTIIHPGDVIAVPRTPDPRPVGDNEDNGNEDNDDFGNGDDGNDDNDDDNSGPGGGTNDDDGSDDGNDDNGNDDDQGDDNSDHNGNDDDQGDDNSGHGGGDQGDDDNGNDDDQGGEDD
jgi:hypothetical protein